MINISNDQMQVIIKIIGAVETGGQVYGQCKYDDYTPAYTNSSAENSITIGAYQEFNWYAKALLQEILDTYPTTFRNYDNAGIESDLKKSSWDGYSPSKTSNKAKAIQAIIGSKEGIKIQDKRIEKLLKQYIAFAEEQGVSDVDALFMSANFIHQGGNSALTRILKKTKKPYTLDNLYKACQSDTGNQVGAYKNRQAFVYNALKKYLKNTQEKEETNMTKIEKATQWMINAANNPARGYDQIYRWGEKGDYDCSSAVITAWETAGVPVKTKGATYTGNMKSVFLKCGFKDVTSLINLSTGSGLKRGDVLLNTVHHTAMYIGNGQEVEASINEKGTATGGKPGDQTGREFLIRSYRNYPWNCVLRYQESSSTSNSAPSSTLKSYLELGDTGADVLTLQQKLNKLGYKGKDGKSLTEDSSFGINTDFAVRAFQKDQKLTVDGQAGKNTISALNAVVDVLTKPQATSSGWVGEVTATELSVRSWAGTEYPTIKSYPKLNKGNRIRVLSNLKASDGSTWYKIAINNSITKNKDVIGFVSAKYIKKV